MVMMAAPGSCGSTSDYLRRLIPSCRRVWVSLSATQVRHPHSRHTYMVVPLIGYRSVAFNLCPALHCSARIPSRITTG